MSIEEDPQLPDIPKRLGRMSTPSENETPVVPMSRPLRTRTTGDLQVGPSLPNSRPQRRYTEEQLTELVQDTSKELQEMRDMISQMSVKKDENRSGTSSQEATHHEIDTEEENISQLKDEAILNKPEKRPDSKEKATPETSRIAHTEEETIDDSMTSQTQPSSEVIVDASEESEKIDNKSSDSGTLEVRDDAEDFAENDSGSHEEEQAMIFAKHDKDLGQEECREELRSSKSEISEATNEFMRTSGTSESQQDYRADNVHEDDEHCEKSQSEAVQLGVRGSKIDNKDESTTETSEKLAPENVRIEGEVSASSNSNASGSPVIIPEIPARPSRHSSASPSSSSPSMPERPKKKAQPPVPKKPSSKIAAFKKCFKKRQMQDSSQSVEKATQSNKGLFAGNRANIASNLNGLFALPGMTSGIVPPQLAQKISSKDPSNEGSSISSTTSKSSSVAPEKLSDRSRRARGPRGRKLPSTLANVEKIEGQSKNNTIQVFSTWSVTFTHLPSAESSEEGTQQEERSIEDLKEQASPGDYGKDLTTVSDNINSDEPLNLISTVESEDKEIGTFTRARKSEDSLLFTGKSDTEIDDNISLQTEQDSDVLILSPTAPSQVLE